MLLDNYFLTHFDRDLILFVRDELRVGVGWVVQFR